MRVEVRGHCHGVSFLLPCRFWGLGSNSGYRFGSRLLYLPSHLTYLPKGNHVEGGAVIGNTVGSLDWLWSGREVQHVHEAASTKDCAVPAMACCPSLDSRPTPSPWSACLGVALASSLKMGGLPIVFQGPSSLGVCSEALPAPFPVPLHFLSSGCLYKVPFRTVVPVWPLGSVARPCSVSAHPRHESNVSHVPSFSCGSQPALARSSRRSCFWPLASLFPCFLF